MSSRSIPSLLAAAFFACLVACKGSGNGGETSKPAPSAPSVSASASPTPTPTPTAGPSESAAAKVTMVDGAKFTPFFPAAGMDGATDKVARPTKEGFAEVAYRKGKDDVAIVTITDTAAVPAVRSDYAGATEKVEGQPLKTSGNYKSAILVADRFQVQIQSQRLKAEQRKAWLAKVDLKGLAALK